MKMTINNHNLPKKRVLIMRTDTLLGAGVENLLSEHCCFTVRGVSGISSDELSRIVMEYLPDVIILDEADTINNLQGLLGYWQTHPDLRVVVLNLVNNQVNVFQRNQVQINKPSDLLYAI